MRVIIILGSIREGRKSDRIANYLHHQLNSRTEVESTLVDLMEYEIPMFDYRWQKVADPAPDLVRLGQHLAEADAMIFISPEYHGSYTGVLKNCVDHYWSEFARKPIGVVSTGSGRMGGINGSIQMQQLVLSLGAFAMPYKLLVPYVQQTCSEDGSITDEKTQQQAQQFVEEFVWFSQAITTAKQVSPVHTP